MYKVSSAVSILALCAASAAFADGPAPAMEDPVVLMPVAPQAVDWSGYYGGLNLSYGSGTVDWVDNNGGWFTFAVGAAYEQELQGTGGGFQLGRNWQSGNTVYGVELGYAHLGLEETATSPFFPASDTLSTSIDSVATLMGRVGFASGNWLPFIEVGLAAGQVGIENVDSVNFPCSAGSPCVFSADDWMTGFAVGLGVDYRISDNSSIGLSYRHVDLGDQTFNGTTSGILTAESYTTSATVDIVSLRWNYHF
jgi:outer membrane immunogenic protein